MGKLQVLILIEQGYYVAQCLEYDIAVQAKTLNNALQNFRDALFFYFMIAVKKQEQLFLNLKPAPKWYWDRYLEVKNGPERD